MLIFFYCERPICISNLSSNTICTLITFFNSIKVLRYELIQIILTIFIDVLF